MTISAPRIRFGLFIALLVLAPLSKYPSWALPLFNFPSFRIGLYQVLAVAFVGYCAIPAWRNRKDFFTQQHTIAAYALIALSTLGVASVSWSLYKSRSLLLAASVALLVAVVFSAWWYVQHELTQRYWKKGMQYMLVAGVAYGALALAQLVIFTLTDATLGVLCRGCLADVFGFPRVNGFAAEPQFFANAMLPFVYTALYVVFQKPTRLAWISFIATIMTIGLTFSRGAYVALALSLFAVGVKLLMKQYVTWRQLTLVYVVVFMSIVASLGLLVASATARHANSPNIAYETTDSIIEHLTLGRIDLPEKSNAPTRDSASTEGDTFVSPGLIEASNQERTSAASLALQAWRSNPMTMIFGVGLGNLGPYVVHHIQSSAPNNLTVYIFYVLILVELGLVGFIALLIIFGSALRGLLQNASLESTMGAGRLVAYAVQFFFYGTYINNVYVWLWVGIALGATSVVTTTKATSVGKMRV